jgi:hypothetical protein
MMGHTATVLPFKDAALGRPHAIARASRAVSPTDAASLGPLPDNVIVLASFARSARRALRSFQLSSPPGGEAA